VLSDHDRNLLKDLCHPDVARLSLLCDAATNLVVTESCTNHMFQPEGDYMQAKLQRWYIRIAIARNYAAAYDCNFLACDISNMVRAYGRAE
jgi:hypothetical protein